MDNSIQHRRYITILVIILLIVVIVAAWAFTHRPSGLAIKYRQATPASMAAAAVYDKSDIVVPGDNGLTLINLSSGASHPLPNSGQGLSNVDSVSVSADHSLVLFHDSLAQSDSALYKVLQARGLALATDYWWVYSVSGQSFTPLPAGTLLAKFSNNNIATLSLGSSGEDITLLSGDSFGRIGYLGVTNCSNFFPVKNGYILETTNNNILFTVDGVVSRTVLTSASVVGVTKDGTMAVATQNRNRQQNLVRLDLTNYSSNIVANNVGGTPAWLPTGVALFSQLNSETKPSALATYDVKSNKLIGWNFPNGRDLSSDTPSAIFGRSTALLSDNGQDYYLVSSSPIGLSLNNL